MQSLIRTAEQLKIKGLCEINDHTNATESDTEVIYPPHKKIRASRNYENNRLSNSRDETTACTLGAKSSSSQSTTNLTEKDAHQQSVVSQEDSNSTKNKSKSPLKESRNSSVNANNSHQQCKNMASLDMGMVSKSKQNSYILCRSTRSSCCRHRHSLSRSQTTIQSKISIYFRRTIKMEMWWWALLHSHTWTLHLIHQHQLQLLSSRRRWTSIRVPTRKIYHVSYSWQKKKRVVSIHTQFSAISQKPFFSSDTFEFFPVFILLFQFHVSNWLFFCLSIVFYFCRRTVRARVRGSRWRRNSKKKFVFFHPVKCECHKVCFGLLLIEKKSFQFRK